jgi:hypothetical protein
MAFEHHPGLHALWLADQAARQENSMRMTEQVTEQVAEQAPRKSRRKRPSLGFQEDNSTIVTLKFDRGA